MKKKRILLTVTAVVLVFLSVLGIFMYRTFSSVSKMFKLNNKLVSEGYYTAEFEFKMLGLAYYLDNGNYIKAYNGINQLYNQLKTKEGLIKIPEFNNKDEEMDFYLNMQNPETGAFMDSSYPFFTYLEPTMNVLEKLEALSAETGRPLELKYPLKFLDHIDTPEELTTYLDDLSTVGLFGRIFKTPFILAAKLTGYTKLEELKLYTFSEDWKQTLIKWFYDHQDSKTGLWGSEIRGSGKLLDSGDLGPSYTIIKNLFLDEQENDLDPDYKLRYKDEIFRSTLNKIAEPMPDDASYDEIHDWTIRNNQGIKLLTTYLWKTASDDNKNEAKEYIENITTYSFTDTYLKTYGAFSLYPDSDKPDLDGTGSMIHLHGTIGAYDRERQEFLWGS